MLIRHARDDKMYLYDIMSASEENANLFVLTNGGIIE
mgnify:CR=1 FL=1